MKITYDEFVDAAYISFREDSAPGRTAKSIHLTQELFGVHVDLDSDGRMIGIEVLDASTLLPPKILADAERLGAPDAYEVAQ